MAWFIFISRLVLLTKREKKENQRKHFFVVPGDYFGVKITGAGLVDKIKGETK
jgi:hypothetical protein